MRLDRKDLDRLFDHTENLGTILDILLDKYKSSVIDIDRKELISLQTRINVAIAEAALMNQVLLKNQFRDEDSDRIGDLNEL